MKISIFGCGYVGLTTAIGLAEMGNQVLGIDTNEEKVKLLQKGVAPFHEPGLQDLLKKNRKAKRLQFSSDAQLGIQKSDLIICAVATPSNGKNETDLKAVLQVAEAFALYAKEEKIFINKSTVPVGTSEKIRQKIQQKQTKKVPFFVASNPEFLREGSAVKDFFQPDRIVVGIGKQDEKARKILKKLYSPFQKSGIPLLFTSLRNAELIKYASNSFLATKISFANELANYCDLVGGDVKDVARGIGLDPRIGAEFLNAGIGFGGSCLPKDLKVLIELGKKSDFSFHLLQAVQRINNAQTDRLIDLLRKEYKTLSGRNIALWGLSFKPETDDLRDAPSLNIVKKLLKLKAHITVFDPVSMPSFQKICGAKVTYAPDAYSALKNADALLLLTEWNEFRSPDFRKMRNLMRRPLILDGRNVYDPKELSAQSFSYYGIGRS